MILLSAHFFQHYLCYRAKARSIFSAASPADVAPADGPDSPIAMVVQLVCQTNLRVLISPSAASNKQEAGALRQRADLPARFARL